MKMPHSPFATRLSGSAKETELRLRNIFQWKKKRPPVVLLLAAILLVFACGSLVSFQNAAPEDTAQPKIVMDTQYYDIYENYIEIPVLTPPDGEDANEAITAINQALAGLKGEYQAILNGAVGAEQYGLDGVGNHCLLYPSVTDRYISLLFFREIKVTDLNTGHVFSLVYDKEARRQVTVEDALALAEVTEQELYDALSAQYDPQLAEIHPDANVIIQNQALEGFRMDEAGRPIFYLTARLDDADDTVQDSVSGADNLFIWTDGTFALYDQYAVTDLKPLVPAGETVELDPPLWCQWYFAKGEPEDGSVADSYQYVNEQLGFTMEFPVDWMGKIEMEEQYGLPHGDHIITVYHKETHEREGSGILFRIVCYPGELRKGYSGVVVLRTERITYLFSTPSDVQYSKTDARLAEEYQQMTKQFEFIMEHVDEIASSSKEGSVSAPVPVSAVDATEEVLNYIDVVFTSDQVRMLCWLFPGTGPIGVPVDDYYEQVRQVFAQYTWTREEHAKIADEEDQNAWHLNFYAFSPSPNGFFDIIARSSDAWISVRSIPPDSEESGPVYYSYNGEPGSLNYALADLWGGPAIRYALVSLPETIEDGRTLAEAYADAFRELYLAAGAITDYKLCDLAAATETDDGEPISRFVMTYQVKPADSAEPCWRDCSVAEDGWVTISDEIGLELRDGVWRCVLIQ